MSQDRPRPQVTVLDPARPELGDLAGAALVEQEPRPRRRPHPAVVLVVAQLLLLVAGVVGAVQVRSTPDLGLVSRIVLASTAPASDSDAGTGTAEGLGSSAPAVAYTAVVAVATPSGRRFRVLSGDVTGYDVQALSQGAGPRQFVSVVLRAGCAGVGRLTAPDRLDLTVRADGRTSVQHAVLDGVALIGPARRDCGYGSPQESLDASAGSVRRVGATVVLDVVLRNGSRAVTDLLDVQVPGARVTATPALPLALPPYGHDREGAPVAVSLTVSYDQCPVGAGAGGNGPVELLVGTPGSAGALSPLRAALVSVAVSQLRKDLCGGG